jgi:nitroreductase
MSEFPTKPLQFRGHAPDAMVTRSEEFYDEIRARRSVREFGDRAIPLHVVRNCIAAAATAPSGANKQPWTFVLVTDPATKSKIRAAAEAEERAFYSGRAPKRWLEDLAPLGTDWRKPFLDIAPALIAVFAQKHGAEADERHYYVSESVGIAVGFLLAALHHAGLATLTHTPSPMSFLRDVLQRPNNERAYVLIPVGYPADDCRVPDIGRKALADVLVEK